eukprot:CAMPEP_0116849406 /NCGR_PEP_ID=MMETSP0418-20121206/15552_1 /TAXON_ID=1158023 /ORGANISM="Astrosyne radiata, Strain 13vi08-1A" /LENGTH=373 /DNA_ID=CAMNT_0004481119 /DNA_START=80 /DNA_END=1201 /DNA_ORIENTATION=-
MKVAMNNNLVFEAHKEGQPQQQQQQEQQQPPQKQQQQPQPPQPPQSSEPPQSPQQQQQQPQGPQMLNTISDANSILLNQQRNLTFTTQDAAQRSVMEVLARHNTATDAPSEGEESDPAAEPKRKREEEQETKSAKKVKSEESDESSPSDDSGPAPVPPSEEGLSYFNDNDVLSGRGGGTNVHPGNRHFRDLINLHRRAYLKARKNDKPAISRAIVRSIRENNGRFLKRDEKTGLWYEIGDDAAREKTSQALRQRAPEMRKILFESEREQARQEAEEQLRQQQHLLTAGLSSVTSPGELAGLGTTANIPGLNPAVLQQGAANPMLNPLLAMQMNKANLSGQVPLQQDPYQQMSQNLMTAALLGGGINRFAPNGA